MSDMGNRYAVPAEIDRFIDQGFLEVLEEQPDKKTVEFHIPSKVSVDRRRRSTAYRIVWIHPARNVDFCDYHHESPGDLPSFCVEVQDSEGPAKMIDDLETIDDLEAWLEDFRSTSQ